MKRRGDFIGRAAVICLCSACMVGCRSSQPAALESRSPTLVDASDANGVDLSKQLKGALEGVAPGSEVLVAVMGTCSDCSNDKFAPGDEIEGRFARVVIVAQATQEEAARYYKKLPKEYVLVEDPYGAVADKVNLLYPPRLYVTDERGVVVQAETGIRTVDKMRKEPRI